MQQRLCSARPSTVKHSFHGFRLTFATSCFILWNLFVATFILVSLRLGQYKCVAIHPHSSALQQYEGSNHFAFQTSREFVQRKKQTRSLTCLRRQSATEMQIYAGAPGDDCLFLSAVRAASPASPCAGETSATILFGRSESDHTRPNGKMRWI
jgi:hypothetical protein